MLPLRNKTAQLFAAACITHKLRHVDMALQTQQTDCHLSEGGC